MTRPALHTALAGLDACAESLAWAAPYGTDWERALAECPERRWMTWLAAVLMRRGHLRREVLVLCACEYARTALRYVPAGETRPLAAIETAEAWARGEATRDEVRAAADAAYAAYAAVAVAAAADAAYAAELLAITRRALGPALLAGLTAVCAGGEP